MYLDIIRETEMLFASSVEETLLGKDHYYPTYPLTSIIIKCCITN